MTDRPTPLAGTPAIRLTEIRKSYGGVAAVRGVTFDVMPGEVHALVGENGAGKSTLIKMMCGVESHDAGTIEIAGEQQAELSAAQALHSGVVAVHQEFNLLPELTITENITLAQPAGFRLRPVNWPQRRAAAEAALTRIRAHTLSLRRLVRDLSVPEQQLVEIAKALASDTKVLILDEPSAVLGEHEVAQLFQVLRALAAEGTAIVYVSHRLQEIGQIADRVTVIKDGSHVSTDQAADVSPDELVRRMVGRSLDAQFPPRTETSGRVLLEVRDLTVPGLISDVGFTVRAGEIVGLAGLGGSGRTTICQSLVGLIRRRRSSVQLGSTPVPANPRRAARAGVVLIPEDRKRHGIFATKSVAFNLALPHYQVRRRLGGVVTRRSDNAAAVQIMREYGIRAAGPATPIRHLSGGNQQKVVLAKWISMSPQVIVLDEPTRGVDVGAKAEIYRLIAEKKAQGAAIVMTSSELPELLGMCDRIVVLCEGRISAQLSIDEASEEVIMHHATGLSTPVTDDD